MKIRRYKATKEVLNTEKGWEEFETIPKGAICEAPIWNGSETIEYKGKKVCDIDSKMAKDYFEEIRQ